MDNCHNSRGSLKDHVYQQIIALICAGELTPHTLFTENQMCERFGVSKAPVREALIQLCYENVLKSIPRCGYQVVQIDIRAIHDLTELRFYLELSSLQNVEKNLSIESLKTLKTLTRVPESERKDVWASWHNNTRFHLTLTGLAGNSQVNKTLSHTLDVCTRAYAQLFQDNRPVVAPSDENYHDRIVAALERHELYTAHEWLKKDILAMEQLLLGNFDAPDIR